MNLMMLLEMASGSMGERVAFVNGDDRLTYAELFESAGRAAHALRESGADHLAFLDESSLSVPLGVFASAWAGKPFVPLNYRLTGSELESLLAQIAPSQLVAGEERVDSLSSLESAQVLGRGDFLSKSRDAGAPSAAPARSGAAACT